jgi:hypothetical protein
MRADKTRRAPKGAWPSGGGDVAQTGSEQFPNARIRRSAERQLHLATRMRPSQSPTLRRSERTTRGAHPWVGTSQYLANQEYYAVKESLLIEAPARKWEPEGDIPNDQAFAS